MNLGGGWPVVAGLATGALGYLALNLVLEPAHPTHHAHRTHEVAGVGELAAAITSVRAQGATVHGGRWDPLKRVPRGFDPHHPHGELLRWKGVETDTRVPSPPWTTVPEAARAVRIAIHAGGQVDRWLGTHVGPSTLTPEDRFAPRRGSAAP